MTSLLSMEALESQILFIGEGIVTALLYENDGDPLECGVGPRCAWPTEKWKNR